MGFEPLECADLEVSSPSLPTLPVGWGWELLVRMHGEPIGVLTVPAQRASKADAAALADLANASFGPRLAEHHADDRRVSAISADQCPRRLHASTRGVSVIIPTAGTRPSLRTTLQSLLSSDFDGDVEILVVDNRPADSTVQDIVASIDDSRVIRLIEPRPGVSFARNTGIAAARHELLLFTDDDVVVDPGWIRSLVAVFDESPSVSGVSGLVVPASLESPAEQLFERMSSFDRGTERAVWSMRFEDDPVFRLGQRGDGGPLFPYPGSCVGSGNSMAFRKRTLQRVGGFDPALRNGQDLDMFCRVLLAGESIVYEPRAIVRHHHRDSDEALMRQTRRYGVGLSALVTKHLLTDSTSRQLLFRRLPTGVRLYLASPGVPTVATDDEGTDPSEATTAIAVPHRLRVVGMLGLAGGPVHYTWSSIRYRWADRGTIPRHRQP